MPQNVTLDLEELLEHFSTLEDPRSTINRHHLLSHVIIIAIMAVLGGATGPTSIAAWATLKSEYLNKLLTLPYGLPGKDVFRRVLMSLKPAVFQACFFNWLSALQAAAKITTGVERPTFAVDGKTLRRSHDRKNKLGALHSVTVWASEYGLTLAQVATDQKSNEITAIPQVLALVELKGAIVTIDAMGTQTAIAKQIVDAEGDYILALKGNQETLHKAAIEYIDQQLEDDFAGLNAQKLETNEKGHGRVETRTYIQLPVPKDLPGASRWPGLLTLGIAILYCVKNGKTTADIRYFISSLGVNVKQFAHSVRSHWGIENSCHWCLDVTYREDESRIRELHLRENFAWLNRFTLSLLKQHDVKKSVAMKRKMCGWNENYITEVITGQGLSTR